MDFKKEDVLCSGCNTPTSKHVKFCSKCGTKNENYEDFTQPVTMDYENPNNDDNILADESKSNNNKPAGKKGIKYAIILGAIVLIGFLSINVFGKTFFPDKYVKGAMLNTYNTINKNNKEFKDMPGIVSYLSRTDETNENEVYVKFKGLGGDFDRYVSTMLDGYGLKINLQNDLKNSLFNFNLGVFDGSSELVSAQMYGSSDYMSLRIPALYDGHLGVTANSEIGETYSEYDEIRNNATIFAKYYKAVNESKPVIKDKTENLTKELIGLATFEKGSRENTYISNINGDEFLDVLEKHILEFINDENIRNMMFYTAYLESGGYYYSYEEAKTRFDELMAEVPVELKYYINEIKLDDIEVTVTIGDKNLVKDFQVQTRASNEYEESIRLKASGAIENNNNGIKSDYDLKITAGSESLNFGASIENLKKDKNLNKIVKVEMNVPSEETIFFEINEEYDSSSKECNSTIDVVLGSSYEEIPVISLKSNGYYDGKDKIDFDNIDLVLNENNYYTYVLNLSGYIQKKDAKSVNKIDEKDIKFINEMSENELVDLMEDIESNMYLLSDEIF